MATMVVLMATNNQAMFGGRMLLQTCHWRAAKQTKADCHHAVFDILGLIWGIQLATMESKILY